MIEVGDFIMVPLMQCTIYKVTEITEHGRIICKTPMKVSENSKLKETDTFHCNDFKESEVIKIENW
jgi:hypothetical protein